MRQLLDRGADIDAKTEDADTPLGLAVSAGAVGAVGFLVKAGASLESIDKVCWGSIHSVRLHTATIVVSDIFPGIFFAERRKHTAGNSGSVLDCIRK